MRHPDNFEDMEEVQAYMLYEIAKELEEVNANLREL